MCHIYGLGKKIVGRRIDNFAKRHSKGKIIAPTRLPGMMYRGTLHTNALISRANKYGENAMSLSACTTYFSRRLLVLHIYFLELKSRDQRPET